jgi:hypothetical protein
MLKENLIKIIRGEEKSLDECEIMVDEIITYREAFLNLLSFHNKNKDNLLPLNP